MHGLYMTFSALLDPGDEVILPDPMWSEIAELIRRGGGIPVAVPLHPEREFLYDPADIQAVVTPRTKAIYLNTPHNPTGAVLSEARLREIADIAIRNDLYVVSDEAYEHVIFDGRKHVSIGALEGMADRTISSYTFSKSYAMTGLRLGYLVSNDDHFLDRVRKLLRLSTNGIPSITQWGGLAALTSSQERTREMMEELESRRDIFFSGLAIDSGVRGFQAAGRILRVGQNLGWLVRLQRRQGFLGDDQLPDRCGRYRHFTWYRVWPDR